VLVHLDEHFELTIHTIHTAHTHTHTYIYISSAAAPLLPFTHKTHPDIHPLRTESVTFLDTPPRLLTPHTALLLYVLRGMIVSDQTPHQRRQDPSVRPSRKQHWSLMYHVSCIRRNGIWNHLSSRRHHFAGKSEAESHPGFDGLTMG
jgi:hypothetical protein